MQIIEISEKALNLNSLREQSKQIMLENNCGAGLEFTGIVRADAHNSISSSIQTVASIYIEHYPVMTKVQLAKIIKQGFSQWQINGCVLAHRIGSVNVGEPIVYLAIQSSHREHAFLANRFIIDYLKVNAPFWKKEIFTDGTARWVQQRASDRMQVENWQNNDN